MHLLAVTVLCKASGNSKQWDVNLRGRLIPYLINDNNYFILIRHMSLR